MLKALAWYFDFSMNPARYGVTLWSATCDYPHTGVYPPSATNIHITLESAESGTISNSQSVGFVVNESFDKLTLPGQFESYIVLENFPHQKTLESKMVNFSAQIETVERETTVAEQITHYGSLINVERYYVPESLLYSPDLIFDDCSDRNLIDPLLTDDQTDFLQTESFLIGCHFWDQHFKPSGFCFSSVAHWGR